jgi:hypothetical protein
MQSLKLSPQPSATSRFVYPALIIGMSSASVPGWANGEEDMAGIVVLYDPFVITTRIDFAECWDDGGT